MKKWFKIMFMNLYLMAILPLFLGHLAMAADTSIFDDPKVKIQMKACEGAKKKDPKVIIQNCLINGAPKQNIAPVDSALYSKLKTEMAKNKNDKEDNSDEKLTKADTPQGQSTKYDPAMDKLSEYYSKKIEEDLFKTTNENNQGYVNHEVFHDLYKNQISKNVLLAISSYCLDAEAAEGYAIPVNEATRKLVRQENLKRLSDFENKKNLAHTYWSDCMGNLQNICDVGPNTRDEESVSLSKTRACLVTNYLKQTNQTIEATTKIQALFDKIDEGNFAQKWSPSLLKLEIFEEGKDDKATLNKITSITSNEFIHESGFGDEVKEMQQDLEENCFKKPNQKKCQKFFNEDQAKSQKEISEYAFQSKAILDQVEESKNDPEVITVFLKREGRTDAEITELLNDKKSFEQIKRRYENETNELIDYLSNQLEEKSLTDSSNESLKLPENVAKIKKIEEELSSRAEEYKQLIHFNNIVTGYVQTSEKKEDGSEGKVGIDSLPLLREIKDTAYLNPIEKPNDDKDKKEYDLKIAEIKRRVNILEKDLESRGITAEDKTSVASLDVANINKSILSYKNGQQVEDSYNGPQIREFH